MTIQWMLIASFLYFELVMIALLILPFISPKIWHSIFHFHIWNAISKKANMYFSVLIFVLILFFLDSIRDMMKYSAKHSEFEFDAELQKNVKLFRSQRNYYISGFSVFLWLVLRKLVVLVSTEAELLIRNEESAKKAQEATEHVEKLLKTKVQFPVKSELCKLDVSNIKKLQEEVDAKKCEMTSTNQMICKIKERTDQIQQQCEELRNRNTLLQN